uniref:ORF6b n=1 Tax=Infectious bronchitis virus TaxID=11120 RepID=A0A221J5R3_9GAMC|nr:ORF6b [Infectious bronchitis virus]WCR75865.1 6b protein [Infectious bronchitis virus]WCR75875.1 6b protein [Infectious bronchitis virus]WCR75885.1 6b protein [Infectious bronchitis virus]WCR75895.1 6b protein [Infectious bronchitis virus]
MDLLHYLMHLHSHYFVAFLSIITGIDCDYVQYLSYFWLLFACCIVAVLFIIVILISLLYRRSSIVRVKEDRHVA